MDHGKRQFYLMRHGFQNIREALEITLSPEEADACIIAAQTAIANTAPGKIFGRYAEATVLEEDASPIVQELNTYNELITAARAVLAADQRG